MNQNEQIGTKIKYYRVQQQLTLKQVADRVDLSVGFLSQVERGLTALSLNTLSKLADAYGINITAFFSHDTSGENDSFVVRSYERNCLRTTPDFIHYSMSRELNYSSFFPEIFELFPGSGRIGEAFQHKQEEYIYVLEGVLTVQLEEEEYTLYPGDGMQIPSNYKHIWQNNTPHMVKVFSVALHLRRPDEL